MPLVLLAFCLLATPAWAGGAMSEREMRTAFFGATLEGEYSDGLAWSERFDRAGRSVYSQDGAQASGRITFESGTRICFTYPDRFNGGCFEGRRRSLNCFDFYGVDADGQPYATLSQRLRGTGWTARAWRTDQPNTCESVPVG